MVGHQATAVDLEIQLTAKLAERLQIRRVLPVRVLDV